jgi:hypothetical protein
LSSLSPQIAKQVKRIKVASEIWRLLKETYSGVGNEMLARRIQKELQSMSQGENTMVEYVSELKRLWSDLDYFDPIEMECGKCVQKYNKWIEMRRVREFLYGLNQRFENRRATIYGSERLPSLEQAISAIVSEANQLKLGDSSSITHSITQGSSALLAAYNNSKGVTSQGDKNCFECGNLGHIRINCPELIGGGRRHGQG